MANEETKRAEKSAAESRTEQVHLLFPRSMNHQGRLYGGQLLGWIDEIAAVVAMRHCGGSVVTAAVDRLDFKAGAKLGDMVYIQGNITYVGTSSMEVRIDSYVEEKEDGLRHLINRAYFVMVAVDENGKPVPVPGLKLETIGQEVEWEAGKRRQQLRKMRMKEGF